jgi:hypothetical protein
MSGTTPDGFAGPGPSSASVRLGTVVLDCPDPHALARFYAGLLGQPVDPDGDDDWQSLAGNGSGVALAFQRAARHVPPSWPDGAPQQLHLDLTVQDMGAAHARAVELGARPLDPEADPAPEDSRGFRVYADPAGHPFCLCR